MTTAERILALHHRVHAVLLLTNADSDWRAIYDFVFIEYKESQLRMTWADPDTSYEEDVLAFVAELDRVAAPYLVADRDTKASEERADIVAFLQNTPARSPECIVDAIRKGAHVGWSKR